METKEVTDKIIDGLKKAALEIEEFQLQFALGKAEAKDKYEIIKKDLNHFIHETSLKVDNNLDKASEYKTKFEELQLQLSLGKADTIDTFKTQKSKIIKVIEEIEYLIKHNKVNQEYVPALKIELEKFKVKLDVLYVSYGIESKKKAFGDTIDELKAKYIKKEDKNNWEHFSNEIENSFKHFKDAFKF